MRKKISVVFLAICLLICAFILSACGSKTYGGEPNDASNNPPSKAEQSGSVGDGGVAPEDETTKPKPEQSLECSVGANENALIFTLNSDRESFSVSNSGTSCAEHVVIPSAYNGKPVTRIGSSAFSGCIGLLSIEIPNSVTSIEGCAFFGCSGLTSIVIPSGVTNIGNSAFYGCLNLSSVTYLGNIKGWCELNELNTLMAYGNENKTLVIDGKVMTGALVIPNGTARIGGCAFAGCKGLTSVEIPDSVAYIGDNAFSGCKGLTNVTIPYSVTSIGNGAFYNCGSLASVTIGSGVVNIGSYAFFGCIGLTSIELPFGMQRIGSGAFSDCSQLANVTFADPTRWQYGNTAISASNLSDAITAAKYLRDTYRDYTWTRIKDDNK